MAVDPQHPGDLARDAAVELEQGAGELVELDSALGLVEGCLAAVEEHLGLEHEAIADDPDVGPIAEDGAQAPEKVGPVA